MDLNSNHATTEEDADDYWCGACESHTTVYFKEEPDEDNISDDEEDDGIDQIIDRYYNPPVV